MKIRTERDAQRAAEAAAAWIARRARNAIADGHPFALALSGGSSPLPMFDALATADIPWRSVSVYQVDERLVPADSAARNFLAIRERLLERVAIPADQVHPMPVECDDPVAAAAAYAATLRRTLGPAGILDVAHLGLGADGHTASLIPGDPALEETDAVIVSRPYQGTRRLSLSFSILSAARARAWLITGADKRDALTRLLDGDPGIPAGRVERRDSMVFTDLSVSPDT